MLLQELIGVKAYYTKTANEILRVLDEKYGIRTLGMGRFAVTLGYYSWNHVIKIFPRDDCYMKFLNFVAANPGNPHLPKLILKPKKMSAFFKRDAGDDHYYVAKVEKLVPLDNSDEKELDPMMSVHGFWQLADAAIKGENLENFLKKQKLDPKLAEFVKTAVKITQDGDVECFTDLHFGNIMKRKDGTFVITDPLAGYTDYEASYDRPSHEWKKLSKELMTMLMPRSLYRDDAVVGRPKKGQDDHITQAVDFLSKALK